MQSTFVDSPQQAADHVAQNLNWAVTVLMEQVLAHGINAVVAMAPELGGSSASNLSMTNTAPSGPA